MNKPNKSSKYIYFEKWIDPLSGDSGEVTWPDFSEEDEYKDSYSRQLLEEDLPLAKKHVSLISTPLGLVTLDEWTKPGKVFNFWVGHTNFNISHKIKEMVENIDGVEILDIFTRYRLRVGIGRLFKPNKVMSEITKVLGCKTKRGKKNTENTEKSDE